MAPGAHSTAAARLSSGIIAKSGEGDVHGAGQEFLTDEPYCQTSRDTTISVACYSEGTTPYPPVTSLRLRKGRPLHDL
jgi:hypothetical protein